MHCMNDIETAGSVTPHESVIMAPDDLITVLHTSGSSAFPKGIQVTELAFRSAFERWCTLSSADHIYFSYRPLSWAADRDAVIATLICGGRAGFSTGDVACLMEELAMVRPSDFSGPPSICIKSIVNHDGTSLRYSRRRRRKISRTVFQTYSCEMQSNLFGWCFGQPCCGQLYETMLSSLYHRTILRNHWMWKHRLQQHHRCISGILFGICSWTGLHRRRSTLSRRWTLR